MKRRLCAALGAAAILSASAVPASAAVNPSRTCGPDDIYVRTTVWRGQTIIRELRIASHGGCASSWATGQFSRSAALSQCKRLEDGVVLHNGSFFQLTYPHIFYGLWTAENRAGCVEILHGLGSGRLNADTLPFPV